MKRTRDAAALWALSLTALPTLASASVLAPASKTDAPLAHRLSAPVQPGWQQVIVKTVAPLTTDQRAELSDLGAAVTRDLPIIQSLALRVPNASLAKLAALPFVSHLSSDGQVTKCDEFTVGHTGADVAATQYSVTGSGVGVAVVDSGSRYAHPDLKASNNLTRRVLASPDFVSGSPAANSKVTTDMCGHGTHVMGIIGGNGHESTGGTYTHTFRGIAPAAYLVSVRVLNSQGQGLVSDVVAGVQWCITNKALYHLRVINLSLGHPVGESYTTDPLCQVAEKAWKAGLVVVCAAGNEGRQNSTQTTGADNEGWGTAYGSIQSPGNDPYVITVGATKNVDGARSDDQIATYSSRGPSRLDLICKPDLVAPGNRVISLDADNAATLYQNYPVNQIPLSSYSTTTATTSSPAYFMLSGTSMSAPVVSGAAALLLQKDSTLTPDTVKARLMISADKWAFADGTSDPCTFGAGYLNIPAALGCQITAGIPAMSPSLSVAADGSVVVNIDHALWGKSLWNTGLTDLHAIWGSHAIWGTSTLASSHALWGKCVWNDHALWGNSTGAVDLSSVALGGE